MSYAPKDTGELERVPCPVCGSRTTTALLHRSIPFEVRRCACGVGYLTPRLDEAEMERLYADPGYYSGDGAGYADYELQEQTLRATFRALLDNLARRGMTGGKLLEVGCGFGFLLDEARGQFVSRMGTEHAGPAQAAAAQRADQIFAGGLDAVPGEMRFDTILLNQVVEHLYDPGACVRAIYERLVPGGRVVVATPDLGGSLHRWMGSRWPSFKCPEHVVYFDRRTLGDLLRNAGFDDVQPLPYPHAFPLGLVFSKLRIPLPRFLGQLALWIPGTTVAVSAVKRD